MSAMRAGVRTWALAVTVGGALWACSSSESSSPARGSLDDLGIADGAEKGLSKRLEVDGTMEAKLGLRTGAEVQIPKGAVGERVTLGIERPADDKALALIEKFEHPDRVLSAPYVLTPHGTKFLRDVTITLPVAKMGDRNVQVAYLEDENDKNWEIISVPKMAGKQVSIEIGHFSVLVLIESDEDVVEPDAAAELDAGVDSALIELDAAEPLDASIDIDTSVVEMDGGLDAALDAAVDAALATTLYQRLVQCELVDLPGTFVDHLPPQGPYEQCKRDCLVAASCQDVQEYQCFGAEFNKSAELATCEASCSKTFICPETSMPVKGCDGVADCLYGADEVGCPAGLTLSCGDGTTHPVGFRCDGDWACMAGEDEQNCPFHTCESTGYHLSARLVCNGQLNCGGSQPDDSDERNCATFVCPIPQ